MCRGGCNRVMYEGSHCSVVNSASVYIGSHEKLCMLNGSSCSNINLGRQVVCFKDLSSATSSSSSSALLHKPSSAFTKCHVSTVAKVQADKSAQLPIKISATNRRKGKSRNRSVPVHGMLQQRETKAKTERGDGDFLLDSRMSFKDRVKSKFHLKHCEGKEDSIEDPEDPYAFPDPVSVDVLKTSTTNPSHNSSSTTITTCTTTTTTTTTTITTTTATTTTTTITTNNINTNNNNIIVFGNAAAVTVSNAVSCSTVSGSGCSGGGGGGGGGGCGGLSTSGKPMESGASHQPLHWVRTSGEAGTTTASSAIGTPIAKLYPELAEKLEGRRTQKPDQKKGKVESSRSMNRLQTKIAQNKIKDKLKKTQDYPGNPTPCFSSTSLTTPSLNLSSSACCKTASESAVALAFMKPSPSVVLTSATTSTTTSTVTNTTTSTTTTTVTKPVTDSGFSISETHVKTSPHISTAALSPGLTQVPISTPPSQLPPSPLQTPFHTASSHTNSLQNMSSATNPTLNVTTSELKVSHKQPVSPTSPLSHSLPNCHLKSPCPNSTKCEAIWSPSHAVPHSPQHTEHKFSVLHTKPNKLNVPDNKEVISKLKSESAMAFYMMHQKKAIQNHDWLNCGLNSSEDDENSEDEHLPWQNDWLVLSSDEDVKDENLSPHYRSRKLAIRRAQLRRQVVQSQVAGCFNANIQLNKNKATLALIHALRDKPPAALKSLHFVLNKPQRKCNVHKMSSLRKRFCCYQNEDDGKCNKKALPCTNHCIKHIMYNVDQQLFDYCTAKFADNTQCCVPVFDIKHDLPLCEEHAAKADNYQRVQSNESKHKRPRKKPKPAALTRPPKKGKKKKKKNQRRNVRPQESVRRAERLENTEPGSVDESSNIVVSVSSTAASNSGAIASPTVATSQSTIPTTTAVLDTSGMLQDSLISAPEKTGNILPNLPPTKRAPISLHIPMELPPVTSSSTVGSSAELNHIDFAKLSKNFQDLGSVLDGGFSPDSIDKSFELPLDQASKLLEQDLQEVFNNDTFDIFSAGRNGEYDPTKEESEDLERALAAAYKDIRDAKEKLDKLSRVGDQSSQLMDVNDEEWTKDIADSILNSVQTNTVPVTATNLTPGNGLASELMKDNLNVLDNSDLTANSLPMSSQVVNQPVGSIATAASNGGNSVLPYGWINFNMASVPSSLAEQPLSNNLFINSKHVPLASTQSIASDLALTSAHISTNVPHLSSSIYRSASSNRTVLSTNSKETAMEGNTSLRHMVPQHSATEPKPLSSSESPLVTSQQATCQEVTHTISSQSAAVTSAQTVLSAHVSMNSQTSTQLATSIQMPSSQTAILPTLLSMQGGSLRPGIWPSAGVTAGIPVQYYNGLPTSARIPFVQNMDSGLPPGSSAKFQLNSHLDSGDYKQDLTFTSLPHSMGSSHGGAQRTRTEKSQGSMPGSVTKSNSSGENT